VDGLSRPLFSASTSTRSIFKLFVFLCPKVNELDTAAYPDGLMGASEAPHQNGEGCILM